MLALENHLLEAANQAANAINFNTTGYWHKHTNEDRKNQPNERNLTNQFVFKLVGILESTGITSNTYFEATVKAKRLDALICLPELRHFILIETKHLHSQTEKSSIATDIRKMQFVQDTLIIQRPNWSFTHIIISDNWFDSEIPVWVQDPSLSNFKRTVHPIRKTDQYNWQLLLGIHHVA